MDLTSKTSVHNPNRYVRDTKVLCLLVYTFAWPNMVVQYLTKLLAQIASFWPGHTVHSDYLAHRNKPMPGWHAVGTA